MLDQQLSDVVHLRGHFRYILRDGATGRIIETGATENTVATVGRSQVLKMIYSGGNTNSFGWMAVGTTTTAPATSDTGLTSEVSRIAVGTFDTTNVTSTTPNMNFVASWNTNQANTTLGEVGLFNTSSANAQTLLAHATFATINKANTNTLTITYTISN